MTVSGVEGEGSARGEADDSRRGLFPVAAERGQPAPAAPAHLPRGPNPSWQPRASDFQRLKNPKEEVCYGLLSITLEHGLCLPFSTLLSTGDRNVQGHGLYTVLLPLFQLNSYTLACFILTYYEHWGPRQAVNI